MSLSRAVSALFNGEMGWVQKVYKECIGVMCAICLFSGLRQNVQGKIIASLCLAILGLLVLFIVAGFASLSGNGCVAAGAFLHYFLLASFGWMLMEGIHLWRLVIHVFSSQSITDTSLFIMMSSITWGELS